MSAVGVLAWGGDWAVMLLSRIGARVAIVRPLMMCGSDDMGAMENGEWNHGILRE